MWTEPGSLESGTGKGRRGRGYSVCWPCPLLCFPSPETQGQLNISNSQARTSPRSSLHETHTVFRDSTGFRLCYLFAATNFYFFCKL